MPENAADVPHLEYLHGPFMANGTDVRKTRLSSVLQPIFNSSKLTSCFSEKSLKFLRHVWVADWKACEEEGKKHLSVLKLDHYGYIFGIKFPPLNFHVVATQVGCNSFSLNRGQLELK